MGYVEETGVARFRRDARIITIYEGTTGIQANDLISRKSLREGGETLRLLTADLRGTASELRASSVGRGMGEALAADIDCLEQTVEWILANGRDRLADVLAGAVPFLHLLGTVCGSWQMGRAAMAAQRKLDGSANVYYQGIIDLASFWFAHHAVHTTALGRTVRHGGSVLTNFDPDALLHAKA